MAANIDFAALARQPLRSDDKVGRVEICMMKHTVPDVEVRCAEAILRHTDWPFRYVAYDNRLNPANTAKMWNKFVREATCPYVCIIDSDAFAPKLDPCWLTRMICALRYTKADVILAAADRCANAQQKRSAPAQEGTIEEVLHPWSSFVFLFRRDLTERFGPFDEDFYAYGPDTEFAVRLRARDGQAHVCSDVWFQHLHGATHRLRPERDQERIFARDLFRAKKRALESETGNR